MAVSTARSSGVATRLLPVAVGITGALCLWKLLRTCTQRVHPKCVTVVYVSRRRAVLCTSADDQLKKDPPVRPPDISVALYLSNLVVYCSRSRIVIPPSSYFGSFTFPRSVFEPPGEVLGCVVEHVHVSDGLVNMVLTIHYMIPFDQLERYLAAVGPVAPNEIIASAAAAVARVHCSEVSVGILLGRQRREAVFMEPFREHLTSKLLSEAATQLLDIAVENVELVE